MQAATVEILITKAKFEPQVAVAVAEGIDMALESAQLVTVPILNARFAEVNASFARVNVRFEELNTRLIAMDGEIRLLAERMKRNNLQLIVCTLAIVVGNDHLGDIAAVVANALRALAN